MSAYALMVLSGLAGLGYEVVWTRMLAVGLGHEIVATLAVLGAFFSGLALGAFLFDRPIRRSQRPALWYALLEGCIGVWAGALVFLIPRFNTGVLAVIGAEPRALAHWAFAFVGTVLLLLPATAAMGATLPAMERLVARWRQDGWAVGGLYASNTLGAVAGTLIATFWLAPRFGFSSTLWVLASVNGACALGAFLGFARVKTEEAPVAIHAESVVSNVRLAVLLVATGFLGIGYEVVVIRVLSQLLDNTIYTFASVLSVYLLGTSIGAALYQRLVPKQRVDRALGVLLDLLSATCLTGVVVLGLAPSLSAVLDAWRGSVDSAVIGEILVALCVFLLPTVAMGACFSHLAQMARDRIGLGTAIALNTLGGALAPASFGVVVLPALGSKLTLLLIAAAYLPFAPRVVGYRRAPAAAALVIAAVLALAPLNLRYATAPEGGAVLAYQEGVMASIAVVRDSAGTRFLKVNDQYTMGGTASGFSDRRQAHIPLLLHPDPKEALFLGLGTGATFVAAAVHPELRATGVELLPGVLSVLGQFGPSIADIERDGRLRIVNADARRFVQATDRHYDVIVADVFHPSRDGAASLYTAEHFAAIREHLTDEGLFCQWLPLFQLDLRTLRTIIRTFIGVYPHSEAYLAHFSLGQPIVGLIGRKRVQRYSRGYMRHRVRDRRLAEDLINLRLTGDFELFGSYLGGADALRKFAGPGRVNTDDLPVVSYQAPGFLYRAPEPAHVRLLALVSNLEANPAAIVDETGGEDRFGPRLAAYWRARNRYLEVGVGVEPSDNLNQMLDQIETPLLSLVEVSADFGPAYLPLLHMAYEIRTTNPGRAHSLLARLEAAGPERAEARTLRHELFGD